MFGKRTSHDFDDEIRAHLDLEADRLRAQGLCEADARLAARRAFGNVAQTGERFYEAGRWAWADALWRNLRLGARVLARSPGSSALAVAILALAIGANTAIFSLLNALLLRKLPVARPDQLALFGRGEWRGSQDELPNGSWQLYSYDMYRRFQRGNPVFSDVAAVDSILFTTHGRVGGGSNLEKVGVELVSGTFFQTLGVQPFAGRLLTDADDGAPGQHPVAVANYAWWQRRLNGDPSALGSKVAIASTVYTIIGVSPPGFFGVQVGQSPDLWVPLAMEKEISPGWNGLGDRLFQSLYIFARRKPGVSLAQANAQTNVRFRQMVQEYAGAQPSPKVLEDISHAAITLTPAARGLSQLRLKSLSPLQILMAVVALVLLIACANVANLLLARGAARQREIAIRMSIGAGRGQVIRQLLVEAALLGIGGALGGVLLAWGVLLWIVAAGPDPLPLSVSPDLTVLAFALAVTLLTVLVFGAVPAFRATRLNLMPALKEGRGTVGDGRRNRLSRGLIATQVALSLALLAGAGLFLRSLDNLMRVDLGFDRQNVLLTGLDPVGAGYHPGERLQNMMTRVEERVAAVPGIHAASFALFVFDGGSWSGPVIVPGRPESPQDPEVYHDVVGPQYLAVLRMPLLLGRNLSPRDDAAAPPVAVINQTMARIYFPGGSPIGRTYQLDPASRPIQVVGVVKDAKYLRFEEKPRPAAFYPHTQRPSLLYTFAMRYTGDPKRLIPRIRQAVAEVDPNLAVGDFSTLAEKVDHRMSSERTVAQLSSLFGLLAALLACAGIYGVMSYAIARRTNEFGVRMALGARRVDIRWMVLSDALWLALIGVAIGTVLALAAGQWIESALFDLKPYDPLAFGGAAALMLSVSLFAAWLPARRATRIDPVVALRYE